MKYLIISKIMKAPIGILLFISIIGLSCNNYKVMPLVQKEYIQYKIENSNHYVIIHDTISVWHMESVVMDTLRNVISGIRKPLSINHIAYQHTTPGYGTKPGGKAPVTTPEIHLYISGTGNEQPDGRVEIPLGLIRKADEYRLDGAVNAIPAFIAVALLGSFVAVVATASCPFVYAIKDGDTTLQGELFSGSVYPTMEKEDMLPLNIGQGGQVNLVLSNQLQESDYINSFQLIAVSAPEGCKVLSDASGRFHTIRNFVVPTSATSGGKDVLFKLIQSDNLSAVMDEEPSIAPNFSFVDLSFQNPGRSSSAKLVLKAKNTLWSEYVYEAFWNHFGSGYDAYVKKLAARAPEKNASWTKAQGMSLQIQVKVKDQWKDAGVLAVAGPYTWREWLVPVQLPDNTGETIQIRLKGAYRFWEFDQVSIDYSSDEPIKVDQYDAVEATIQDGVDVRKQLIQKDNLYLEHPQPGMSTQLKFDLPPGQVGLERSLFVRSSGYYTSLRKPKGPMQRLTLMQFRKEGAMSRYSHHLFREYQNGQMATQK